jgi:hypothetical protein
MKKTLYMVVEHFKNNDAVPVYRRFNARGRLDTSGPCPYLELDRSQPRALLPTDGNARSHAA